MGDRWFHGDQKNSRNETTKKTNGSPTVHSTSGHPSPPTHQTSQIDTSKSWKRPAVTDSSTSTEMPPDQGGTTQFSAPDRVGAARRAHFSTPCRSMSSLSDPRRVLPWLRMVSRWCIVLRDVGGPSGHDRAAGIEQVGTLVGALNAFDGVAERQFGDLAVDALLGAPRPERRPQPVCGAAPVE